jgi:hypothetical protein
MNENWRAIYGKPAADPKQRDIELILRLFALFENIESYTPPMKDFLSREMAKNREFKSERAQDFSASFLRATETVVNEIKKPFRPRGLLNAATLEAVMVAIMEQDAEIKFKKSKYQALLENASFLDKVTSNTSSTENVKSRKEIAVEMLFGNE